jgi:hypothetical protein
VAAVFPNPIVAADVNPLIIPAGKKFENGEVRRTGIVVKTHRINSKAPSGATSWLAVAGRRDDNSPAALDCSKGTFDNSPAFQCRVDRKTMTSPGGTTDVSK